MPAMRGWPTRPRSSRSVERMNMSWLQHVNVKVYARTAALDLTPAIDIFHRWIQSEYGDHLLLDVADYRHVPAGPGVILVAHEAIYGLDEAGHQLGMLYNRRTRVAGEAADAIGLSWREALAACAQLEKEPGFGGELQFDGAVAEVFVNDRRLAPNDEATAERLRAELQPLAEQVLGSGCELRRLGEQRDRIGFLCRGGQELSVADAQSRLSG